jgi:hypothetical protein
MAINKPRKIRALTIKNILRYLRQMDKSLGHPMVVELKSDQSGCLRDTVSNDIIETWTNLTEFNDVLIAASEADDYVIPVYRKNKYE